MPDPLPPEALAAADEIENRGVLVGEVPPGTDLTHFMRDRNAAIIARHCCQPKPAADAQAVAEDIRHCFGDGQILDGRWTDGDVVEVAAIIARHCIVPREAKLRRAVDGLKGAALALKSSGMTSTAKAIETIVAEIEGRS